MLSIEVNQEESGVLCLRLAGEAAIQNAIQLRDALAGALEKVPRIKLDLAEITDMDLTCLQLLCAANHGARGMEKSLVLDDRVPGSLPEFLRRSGFLRCNGCARSTEPGSCLWTRGTPAC